MQMLKIFSKSAPIPRISSLERGARMLRSSCECATCWATSTLASTEVKHQATASSTACHLRLRITFICSSKTKSKYSHLLRTQANVGRIGRKSNYSWPNSSIMPNAKSIALMYQKPSDIGYWPLAVGRDVVFTVIYYQLAVETDYWFTTLNLHILGLCYSKIGVVCSHIAKTC